MVIGQLCRSSFGFKSCTGPLLVLLVHGDRWDCDFDILGCHGPCQRLLHVAKHRPHVFLKWGCFCRGWWNRWENGHGRRMANPGRGCCISWVALSYCDSATCVSMWWYMVWCGWHSSISIEITMCGVHTLGGSTRQVQIDNVTSLQCPTFLHHDQLRQELLVDVALPPFEMRHHRYTCRGSCRT